MKIKIFLLLLTAVLPANYTHANEKPFSSYPPPFSDSIYDVNMTPLPIETLFSDPIKLMEAQSSVDRMKTELDKMKVKMRYFLKKDVLKKNGMRPIIRRKSITFRYTYRW